MTKKGKKFYGKVLYDKFNNILEQKFSIVD